MLVNPTTIKYYQRVPIQVGSQASDWAGAFWTSLSGLLINTPLLGVCPSMTFC